MAVVAKDHSNLSDRGNQNDDPFENDSVEAAGGEQGSFNQSDNEYDDQPPNLPQ